ncbi:hypothetical protein ACFQ44_01705 [Levilactobacillus lanxiensis]|uniref:Lipoprotein n=1 Tax=Levilactobacillus lanxiensis TaxID=2799568 RepID=A0ABW4D336_9LACO|nr:hypothetical protein [Levilactobacillus lanxiensis]
MQTKAKLLGLALVAVVLVSGCRAKSTTQQKLADQPQPSKLTTLLQPVRKSSAEDTGTRTNQQVTYSRFTYHQNHWQWALTTNKRTVIKGIITGVKSQDGLKKLTVKLPKKQTATVTFSWGDDAKQAYNLKSTSPKFNRNFIVGDNGKGWTAGVPAELKGTWQTDLYAAKRYHPGGLVDPAGAYESSSDAFMRTTFYVNADSLDGHNDTYNQHKELVSGGSGWGVNQDVSYKKLAHNNYWVKSYGIGNKTALNIYRVQLTNDRLKLIGVFGNIPAMTQLTATQAKADRPYGAAAAQKGDVRTASSSESSATTSTSSSSAATSAVDTHNLTTDQVNQWVWLHLKQDYAGKHITIQDMFFTQTTNDDGTLTIRVKENHSTENMKKQGVTDIVDPTVGWYGINSKGELTDNTTGDNKVIATEYGK